MGTVPTYLSVKDVELDWCECKSPALDMFIEAKYLAMEDGYHLVIAFEDILKCPLKNVIIAKVLLTFSLSSIY